MNKFSLFTLSLALNGCTALSMQQNQRDDGTYKRSCFSSFLERQHLDMRLRGAAKANNVSLVQSLCEQGAQINTKNSFHMTPLHCAAEMGSAAVLDYLIKRGASVAERDIWGLTPLHRAVSCGHLKVVRALCEPFLFGHKQNPQKLLELLCIKDLDGKTALDLANTERKKSMNNPASLRIHVSRNHFKIITVFCKPLFSLSCFYAQNFQKTLDVKVSQQSSFLENEIFGYLKAVKRRAEKIKAEPNPLLELLKNEQKTDLFFVFAK